MGWMQLGGVVRLGSGIAPASAPGPACSPFAADGGVCAPGDWAPSWRIVAVFAKFAGSNAA